MLSMYTLISIAYKCMGVGSVSATTSQCTFSFTCVNDHTAAMLLDTLAVFYDDINEAVNFLKCQYNIDLEGQLADAHFSSVCMNFSITSCECFLIIFHSLQVMHNDEK